MVRERSAGGVVVRRNSKHGEWEVAVIEPAHERVTPHPARTPRLALPKGTVDPGEKPLQTALREVHEETGIVADPLGKLSDSRYLYTRSWSDGKKVSKVVHFYLMRYVSGRINHISDAMRAEVHRASWIDLKDAPRRLAYEGERKIVRLALLRLQRDEPVKPDTAG